MFATMFGAMYHLSQIKKVFVLPQPFNQHFYNMCKLSIFPGHISDKYVKSINAVNT